MSPSAKLAPKSKNSKKQEQPAKAIVVQEDEAKKKKSMHERMSEFKTLTIAGRRMLGYVFKTTPLFSTVYLVTIVFLALLPFLSSWLNSLVIDGLLAAINDNSALTQLYYLVALAILVMLIRSLLRGLSNYSEANLWYIVGREMSHAVTTKYSTLDVEYYEDAETMDLLNKVKENYGHSPMQFTNNLIFIIDYIITIFSALGILLFFNPVFIVILLITTLPRVVVNILYGKRTWGIWNAKGDIRRDYYDSRYYLTSESSLMELRIFRIRKYILQKVYDLFYNFQVEQIAIENKRSLVNILVDALGVVGYGTIFVATAAMTLAQKITIGQFSFYMSTTGTLQGALNGFFNSFSRAYTDGLYVVDIFKVLDLEEKIVPGEVCLANTKSPPKIEFNNVTFCYPGTTKKILNSFDLTINPGDHVAIVGENGAGKSTLIKTLMRFYDVTAGEILIDDINIKHLDLENWYTKVGALFQEFNFYHFDAKTNIAVGDTEFINDFDRIVKAAKKSGAHEFIKDYEFGYDQIMSRSFKNGIEPSIGQKQKIALARAFFKDAPILILDEPTSAIDPKAEFEIFENLFKFAEGKTVIIISHRCSTVRNADRIIVLDKGKIVEDGSHDALMKIADGKYKTAFEIQRKGYE